MRKRKILVLLVSALAAGCLAGCGDKPSDDQQTDDNSGETGTDEKNEQEQAAESSGTDNGPVSLRFWCDEEEMALFQQLTDSFVEEHKGEADIKVEFEPVGASECKDVFLSDVINGADVFCMPDDQLLSMASSGVLEEVANAADVAARNLEDAVQAASVDGKLYAYPLTADNGYFLFYDKKYFTQQDVQTLDRILEVCEENNKKFVMDWSSGWYLFSFFGNTGLSLSLNEDGLTNSCNWNAAKGDVTGVDVAQAMLAVAASPGFLNSAESSAAIKNKTAIAAVGGIWDIAAVEQAYGKDYGACRLPTFTCGGKQVQMASFTGYRLLGVNSYSEHREWAEKLADYLSGEECQKIRFEQTKRGPSNSNVAAMDEVKKVPAISAVMEQAEFGVLQKVGQKYWTPVQNFGATMAKGNPGNMPLQDLLDQMVSGITE